MGDERGESACSSGFIFPDLLRLGLCWNCCWRSLYRRVTASDVSQLQALRWLKMCAGGHTGRNVIGSEWLVSAAGEVNLKKAQVNNHTLWIQIIVFLHNSLGFREIKSLWLISSPCLFSRYKFRQSLREGLCACYPLLWPHRVTQVQ